MTQTRGPTRWRVAPVAIAMLVTATAPVGAAVKVAAGQEILYTGTVDWKMSQGGGQTQHFTGPLQLSAVVAEADPAKGYAVIVMKRFLPERQAGQPGGPPEATVGTVRYGVDLTATRPRAPFAGGPMNEVTTALASPLTPRADLKQGDQWTRTEILPLLSQRPVEVSYTVGVETKVGDRTALQIEKKLTPSLPFKQELGPATLLLTEFGQTIKVDPGTGIVLDEEIHGRAEFTAGERKLTAEYRATLALKETRQLSETELASRVKQAEAIERVQQTLLRPAPGATGKQRVEEVSKQIAAFRKEFPSSPYDPALAPIDSMLGQFRSQTEREERLTKLKGSPAPSFALKDLTGKEQTLAAYRGKLILLNFFASW